MEIMILISLAFLASAIGAWLSSPPRESRYQQWADRRCTDKRNVK